MLLVVIYFFFNDTATTEIYTLSLHDALPIFLVARRDALDGALERLDRGGRPDLPDHVGQRARDLLRVEQHADEDRKSTRLNSSHANISYAVFCLKKKSDDEYQTILRCLFKAE